MQSLLIGNKRQCDIKVHGINALVTECDSHTDFLQTLPNVERTQCHGKMEWDITTKINYEIRAGLLYHNLLIKPMASDFEG